MTTILLAGLAAFLIFSAALKFRRWQHAHAERRTARRMAHSFLGRPVGTRWLDQLAAGFRRWVADRLRYALACVLVSLPIAGAVLVLAQFGGKT